MDEDFLNGVLDVLRFLDVAFCQCVNPAAVFVKKGAHSGLIALSDPYHQAVDWGTRILVRH